jgi:diguanylate cyclase (GGDEF)-like protein
MQWLPRDLALAHPSFLDTAMRRAIQTNGLVERARQAADELADCRRQADRLVSLLWETSTGEAHNRWHSQRQMMERFYEEVARSERHGIPLTLVLGELHTVGSAEASAEAANRMESWTADQILRAKRRADVAGQYGPSGFMLLLVHTAREEAAAFCQRLQSLLEQSPGTSSGPPLPGRVVFGVAGLGSNAFTPKMLLSQAEDALEQARTIENSTRT